MSAAAELPAIPDYSYFVTEISEHDLIMDGKCGIPDI